MGFSQGPKNGMTQRAQLCAVHHIFRRIEFFMELQVVDAFNDHVACRHLVDQLAFAGNMSDIGAAES